MDQGKRLFLQPGLVAEAQIAANDFALSTIPLMHHRQRSTNALVQFPSLLPDIRSFSHDPTYLSPQDFNSKINEILASALLLKRGLELSADRSSNAEGQYKTSAGAHSDLLRSFVNKPIQTEEPVSTKSSIATTIPDDTDSDVSSVDCSDGASQTSRKPRKKDNKWLSTLEELKKYKEVHGDCIVPRGYAVNPRLASWVAEQRLVCFWFWLFCSILSVVEKILLTLGLVRL